MFGSGFFPGFNRRLSDAVPNINRESNLTIFIMAAEKEFERFLQSINLADEYLEQFIKTGYNDLDLLKSFELQEQQDMFNIIGLSTKPGHLLKFKKAIASYDSTRLTAPDKEIRREHDNIPQRFRKVSFFR